MGGHGPAIQGNPSNIQEDDATISQKIRGIELIKHNPNMFYLNFYDFSNHYKVAGGAPTAAFSLLGGWLSLSYFLGAQRTRPFNFYVNIHQGFGRFVLGAAIGAGFGMYKFGDRQRLHNAWVAERLRRRYPEASSLNVTDLWQFKGVQATHEFYRWR